MKVNAPKSISAYVGARRQNQWFFGWVPLQVPLCLNLIEMKSPQQSENLKC